MAKSNVRVQPKPRALTKPKARFKAQPRVMTKTRVRVESAVAAARPSCSTSSSYWRMSIQADMFHSHPADPEHAEIGDTATIPQGTCGHQGSGAWRVNKTALAGPLEESGHGRKLKGKRLGGLIKMPLKRELMAHQGFFCSGKHEEERINDQFANIESAVIQCLGDVQEAQSVDCLTHHGPLVCSPFPRQTRDANISIVKVHPA